MQWAKHELTIGVDMVRVEDWVASAMLVSRSQSKSG